MAIIFIIFFFKVLLGNERVNEGNVDCAVLNLSCIRGIKAYPSAVCSIHVFFLTFQKFVPFISSLLLIDPFIFRPSHFLSLVYPFSYAHENAGLEGREKVRMNRTYFLTLHTDTKKQKKKSNLQWSSPDNWDTFKKPSI